MDNNLGLPIPDDLPPIYHLPPQRFYFYNNFDKYWQESTQDTIKSDLVVTFGQNPIPPSRGEASQVDRALLRIKKEQRIDGVAALGWEEMGIHTLDGKRILVDKGCNRIQPVKGLWKEIETYLTKLFGPDLPYFLGWLATGTRGFYNKSSRRYGQALVLAGPKNSGKSYLQMQIITPVLGGTVGKPYEWLTGKTPFNSDLFEAVHLLSEDDYHPADPLSRNAFGAAIKKICANTVQEYNKKYGSKLALKPYWRFSMSLNGETHYLATLPTLDKSLRDKMVLLQCNPDSIHLPTEGPKGNQMEMATTAELPAFIYYLLHQHEIAPAIADGRYGMKGYVHAQIDESIKELGDEYLLLECMREKYAGSNDVRKTMLRISTDLDTVDSPRIIRKIVGAHYHLRECLEKLVSEEETTGIKKTTLYGGTKGYSLTFPGENK